MQTMMKWNGWRRNIDNIVSRRSRRLKVLVLGVSILSVGTTTQGRSQKQARWLFPETQGRELALSVSSIKTGLFVSIRPFPHLTECQAAAQRPNI